MNTVRQILDFLCSIAPLELQTSYDNSGFLLGRREAPVSRVLLALDATGEVVEEAAELGVQLLITHHPLIWGALKSVTGDMETGEKLLRLTEKGIAVISMHTNLDIARGGVNDVLIRLLGAEPEDALDAEGCGRIGHLASAMPFKEFLCLCKTKLNTGGLRYYDAGRPVEKIAVLGGSGGSAIEDAYNKGCDTFVTADIKYNQFLSAKELGINLIDGDHFCTENPVIPELAARLKITFPDVEFTISKKHGQVISFC